MAKKVKAKAKVAKTVSKAKVAPPSSSKDKELKAKATGYRYKTKDVPALTKADGTLNKKGKKLQYKRPLKSEVEAYKKRDGEYPNPVKQVYHESRKAKNHSDDNLKKRLEEGGDIKGKKYKYYILERKDGKVKYAVSKTISTIEEIVENAKKYNINIFAPNFGTWESKKDSNGDYYIIEIVNVDGSDLKSDKEYDEISRMLGVVKTKKYEEGGEMATAVVEMSIEDMKVALGREPKYPYDFINGKKYVKCFLRPYYKQSDNG